MIEIYQLSKEFTLSRAQRKKSSTDEKVLRVVDNLSFTCQPGRVLTLLGPNGAGKTTTLRMIASISFFLFFLPFFLFCNGSSNVLQSYSCFVVAQTHFARLL